MRSLWTNIIASVLLIAAVGGTVGLILFTRHRMDSRPIPVPPEFPEVVGMAKVEPIETRATATAIGTVLATRYVQLRTELVGTVDQINFAPGEIVKTGKVLVKLDTSVEAAQLESATSAFDIANSTLKRSQQARNNNAISELEFEQARAVLQQAQAEVNRLNALIDKKTLRAPFDARVGLFDLQRGQYLPEGTPITMLQGIEPAVYIDFMMPQHVADFLQVGEEILLDSSTSSLTAKIIAVDSQSDKITRNMMARALLQNPPPSLQPNDSVKVEMTYGPPIPGMKIPYAALRNAPTGAFVYVAEPDEKDATKLRAKAKPVIPGRSVEGSITVLQGIVPGETIVTDGSFKIRPGLWVTEKPAENTNAKPVQATDTKTGEGHAS